MNGENATMKIYLQTLLASRISDLVQLCDRRNAANQAFNESFWQGKS